MARIDGVPARRAGWLVRLGYWFSARMVGKVPEPLTIAAHHRAIFQAYSGYEFFLARARRVDHKLKILGELKAAALVGCPF
jgi:hypothetical protein